MIKPEWGFDTLCVHGSEGIDPRTGAVAPPIYQSSTFAFQNADHGEQLFRGEAKGYIYSRLGNPTEECLEREMAFLEKGEASLALSSGMAAEVAVILTLCKTGDNYVSSATVYGGTHAMNIGLMPRFGIEAREVRATHLDELEAAIDDRTRLLFIETPANPTLDIIDIEACAQIARRHGILLVVDNTFATPLLQRPLEFGADVVVHSATKYIGGHGDTVAGIIVGSAGLIKQVRKETLNHIGSCISPFNAWLLLRGLKTLAVRMRRHSSNALQVAQYLTFHPRIRQVYYPGLRFHPGHELARHQMSDFGGMLAFDIKGSREDGKRLMDAVELCTLAVSLGDCDTLICHPASTTHSSYNTEQLEQAGISETLIRLSVGIEDARDICADLGQALKRINEPG
ncbi:MAG: aminotransferase class I/II-fold pyridoxal phosphate-dependent enzyme [Calditrichaeota bacterium]|nr:aminotransferase class I/II-fold pyridoxal phosphate-dependent enzyme [Calditrichota bacterium]